MYCVELCERLWAPLLGKDGLERARCKPGMSVSCFTTHVSAQACQITRRNMLICLIPQAGEVSRGVDLWLEVALLFISSSYL